MRKWVVVFLVISCFLFPAAGAAQDQPTLSDLEVDLWPEYDDPGVLVIYTLSLPSSVSLPAKMSLRIPTEAGDPNAVAVRNPNGELVNLAFKRILGDKWSNIDFTATMPVIQIEYYDPGLAKDDQSRHFEYTWPGDYGAENVTLQVQQPHDARDMSISPSLGSSFQGKDGLQYYSAEIGSLKAGENFKISMDYQKPSDILSIKEIKVESSQPIPMPTAGKLANPLANITRSTFLSIGVVLVLLVAVGLVVGGGIWFWQSRKEETPSPARRRRRSSQFSPEEDTLDTGMYCHQCGKRAGSGDRFCRSCGSRLRSN